MAAFEGAGDKAGSDSTTARAPRDELFSTELTVVDARSSFAMAVRVLAGAEVAVSVLDRVDSDMQVTLATLATSMSSSLAEDCDGLVSEYDDEDTISVDCTGEWSSSSASEGATTL